MGKSEDPGLCLLGATLLLQQVVELKRQSLTARSMDVEGVHQMRVTSRRSRSGLPIFSSCFKKSQYDRWRSDIKGLTRALGEARDADVQIEYLRELREKSDDILGMGISLLLERKQAQRLEHQRQVVVCLDEMNRSGVLQDMDDRLSKMVERLEGVHADIRGRPGYAAGCAHASLRVAEVLKLEPCVEDPQARSEHHQLRIAIKRLRYTLEVFRPLFDDELKSEIRALKNVQDLLGEMHDCDVWLDGLDAWSMDLLPPEGRDASPAMPGLEAIRADRSQKREKLYTKFAATWSELRQQRFFERLPERFRTGISQKDLGIPLVEPQCPVKLAIISDVHGNMDALTAVLDDAREQGVGAFINLGDMVGSGAYPEEVVRTLSGDHFVGVAGNFDLKVLERSRASKKASARSVKGTIIAAAARDLSKESLDFISSLPMELRLDICGKRLLMVHASPGNPREILGPAVPEERLRELGRIADADIVLVGHSHRAFVRRVDGVLFANPGSVGRPVDGDPRASYAVMNTGDFSVDLRRVGYDVEAAVQGLREKGLPEEVGETLRRGISGRDLDRERCTAGGDRAWCLEKMRGVAQEMNVDHPHAENVLRLATSLFRQLKPLHGLGARDRFLLEAGCLLHDIGAIEGMRGHHRTGYRLIQEMDLPLTPEEKHTVACLARYHRKRPPRSDDPELVPLDENGRKRLFALASILRIADGLDYRHDGAVKDVKCTIGPHEVTLKLRPCAGAVDPADLNLRKSDLFESTFGRKVRVA